MDLPQPIFDWAKKYFAHHGCWHRFRFYDTPENAKFRRLCFPKCDLWPDGLQAQPHPGCGQDFLRFHRQMIRNYKWITDNAPPPKFVYAPWKDFPDWLAPILDRVRDGYRQLILGKLEELIRNPNLDDLGQYIEGESSDFPYIHFTVHDKIHEYELGKQPESDMGVPESAPCNEHFWGFHGWIDEIYARWQRANGEVVDQSPLEPMQPKDMCPQCMKRDNSVSPWLVQWQEYLRASL